MTSEGAVPREYALHPTEGDEGEEEATGGAIGEEETIEGAVGEEEETEGTIGEEVGTGEVMLTSGLAEIAAARAVATVCAIVSALVLRRFP